MKQKNPNAISNENEDRLARGRRITAVEVSVGSKQARHATHSALDRTANILSRCKNLVSPCSASYTASLGVGHGGKGTMPHCDSEYEDKEHIGQMSSTVTGDHG